MVASLTERCAYGAAAAATAAAAASAHEAALSAAKAAAKAEAELRGGGGALGGAGTQERYELGGLAGLGPLLGAQGGPEWQDEEERGQGAGARPKRRR